MRAEKSALGAGWVYSGGMENWLLALFLKSFIALIVFGFICLPIRLAVRRWMPDGRVKRALLKPIGR